MQIEGEHEHCGPNGKLEASGFSYDPNIFLSEGIVCKLAGWKNISKSDTFLFVVEIVKEMCLFSQVRGKKVLVHCHGGYGRTGTLIACYLIYLQGLTAKQAILLTRKQRSKAIENRDQLKFCEKFQKC